MDPLSKSRELRQPPLETLVESPEQLRLLPRAPGELLLALEGCPHERPGEPVERVWRRRLEEHPEAVEGRVAPGSQPRLP